MSTTSVCTRCAHDEPTDLYDLIRVRYETAPIVITSNRAIEEWPTLFGDALLASAAMDRLLCTTRTSSTSRANRTGTRRISGVHREPPTSREDQVCRPDRPDRRFAAAHSRLTMISD